MIQNTALNRLMQSSSDLINVAPSGESLIPPLYENPPLESSELTLKNQENALTRHLPRISQVGEAVQVLTSRCALPAPGKKSEITHTSAETRAYFSQVFLAGESHGQFLLDVLAKSRTSLQLRDPAHPIYMCNYKKSVEALDRGSWPESPSFKGATGGTGFIIAGPSGSGKTELCRRIQAQFGSPTNLSIEHFDGTSTYIHFIPVIKVDWPRCSTLFRLLRNLNSAINTAYGNRFQALSANLNNVHKLEDAVKAACTTLSIGLIIVDGACQLSLRGQYQEPLQFLAELTSLTGIPLIFSCTYPVLQQINRMNSAVSNLSQARVFRCDYLKNDGAWAYYVSNLWSLLIPKVPLPEYFLEMTWKACRGNLKMLVQCISAVHEVLTKKGEIFVEKVPIELVQKIINKTLFPQSEQMTILRAYEANKRLALCDVQIHGDILPLELFINPPSGSY